MIDVTTMDEVSDDARIAASVPTIELLRENGAKVIVCSHLGRPKDREAEFSLAPVAKRLEEIWLPGDPDPVILPRTSEGLYLLQRVRDEAHRFAITYQRQKRGKRMVESILDDVPGLGEARKKAILRQFGSLIDFSETPGLVHGPPPLVGEHTVEILSWLGYTEPAMEELKAERVVYWPDDTYAWGV